MAGEYRPVLPAIDYRTGEPHGNIRTPAAASEPQLLVLGNAGKLLFTGDPSGNLLAFDPASGKILWHFRTAATVNNRPSIHLLKRSQIHCRG
jgi:alcohol dehydrogenase (cytochrome c)